MDVIQQMNGGKALQTVQRSKRSCRTLRATNFHPLMTVTQLTENNRPIQQGILEAYHNTLKESPTFFKFFSEENDKKNRFPTIPLNDYFRVILTDGDDYYHASYVDGHTQAKQYVLAQAPHSNEMESDFYRLLGQVKPEVVVVWVNHDSPEAKLMFPDNKKEKSCGNVKIKVEEGPKDSWKHLKISVSGKTTFKSNVFFGTSSPEDKMPEDLYNFWKFIAKRVEKVTVRECSHLIVCDSGTNKSAAWMVFDTECDRMQSSGKIKFRDSITQLRHQRTGALDNQQTYTSLMTSLEKAAAKF